MNLTNATTLPKAFNSTIETYNKSALVDFIKMHAGLPPVGESVANAANVALDTFQKSWEAFINNFERLFKKKITEADLPVTLFSYLLNLIENNVNLLMLNNPENQELENRWKLFQSDIAYARYSNDSDFFIKSKDFLNEITRDILALEHSSGKLLSSEQWEWLHKNCQSVQMLDLSLGYFFKKVKLPNVPFCTNAASLPYIELPVTIIQKIFLQNCQQLSKSSEWIFDKIENILLPWTNLPQDKHMNCSVSYLKKLRKHKINLLEKLPFTYIVNLENIFKIKLHFDSLFLPKNLLTRNSKLHLSILDRIIKSIEDENKSENETDINEIYKKLYFTKKCHTLNSQVVGIGESVGLTVANNNHVDLELSNRLYFSKNTVGSWTLQGLKQQREALEAINKCAMLFDTYISSPQHLITFAFTAIFNWCQSKHQLNRLLICTTALAENNFSLLKLKNDSHLKQNQPNEDLDKMAAAIQGRTKKPKDQKQGNNNSRPIKKIASVQPPQKNSTNQILPNEDTSMDFASNSVIGINSSIPKQLISSEKNPSTIEKLLNKHYFLIRANSSHAFMSNIQQIALRQSLLNLKDLRTSFESLTRNRNSPSFNLLKHVTTIIGSSHYHMEEMIRYYSAKSNPKVFNEPQNFHNLKKMVIAASIPSLIDTTAAKLMYLSNCWLAHTFEQAAAWREMERTSNEKTPEVLKLIQAACFNPKEKVIQEQITKYFHMTIEFSNALLEVSEGIQSDLRTDVREMILFKCEKPFNKQSVISILKSCKLCLDRFHSENTLPAVPRLQQACQGLVTLEGTLDALNQKEVTSEEFSQLVRTSIYWQNLILENLLHAIFSLNTGISLRSHDLVDLYKIILSPEEQDPSVIFILENDWKGINNLSRYPYQQQKMNEAHEIILQADFLREHPEIEEGFKIQSMTPLELVHINQEEVNSNILRSRLEKLLNKASVIIEKHLILELNKALTKF